MTSWAKLTNEIKSFLLRPYLGLILANNETGVIQPITEICEGVRRHNKENDTKVLVHTDASQVFGKIDVKNIRSGH